MKAIITGGTGFIGFNLLNRLHCDGWDVLYTGRPGEQIPDSACRCLGYDFTSLDWAAIGRVDVLFHQAAITDTTDYDRDRMFQVNTFNALRLFDHAVSAGCRQIVYASSCATYGDVAAPFCETGPARPLNVYGESKFYLDAAAMAFGRCRGVNVVGLRYSNVFGPHEDHKGDAACMVTRLGQQMTTGRPRLFKWGEQRRDFVYVKDVVEYNMAAAKYVGCGVFNAGSGTATSFAEVVAVLNGRLKVDRQPEYIENPYEDKYQGMTLCDMSAAAAALGVRPAWSLAAAVADYFPPFAS